MITVGGSAVASPALTRAIREFGEQAKKRLDETGSLAGFEAEFSDDSSADGSVTISISAMGAAAYGAQYGKDDTILAYTVTTAQPDGAGGTATSLSSGSSEIIQGDQDVDTFIARFQDSTEMIHYGAFLYGTPEEIAAYSGVAPEAEAAPVEPAPADAAARDPGSSAQAQAFAKLQEKQSAASRLIGLLQSFLDGRDTAKRGNAPADGTGTESPGAAAGDAENATRSRLARFAGTDVST